MPEITFTVDNDTGQTSIRIKGIKGKSCQPIYDAVNADLTKILGAVETVHESTPELREPEVRQANRIETRTRL